MFMCVSSVVFRAVSSGSAVIAAFRFAAFEDRSLLDCRGQSLQPSSGLTGGGLHLSELVHIGDTGRARDLVGVLLVPADSQSGQVCGIGIWRILAEARAKREGLTCSARGQSPPPPAGTGSARSWPRKSPAHRGRTSSCSSCPLREPARSTLSASELAAGRGTILTSTVTRFSFMPRTSLTSAWYVQLWDSIGTRSTFRSRMTSTAARGHSAQYAASVDGDKAPRACP